MKPPFSIRQDPERREEFYALQPGVPAGLRPALRDFTVKMYLHSNGFEINRARLTRLELSINKQIIDGPLRTSTLQFSDALTQDDDLLLDAADFALRWATPEYAAAFELLLVESRSAYSVGRDSRGEYEIQMRQSQEMSELVENETNQTGRAAKHLRTAWSKCFGRSPDPKGACRETVEAIEVAAKPVIAPNDSMATLGKMCAAIRDKPDKWTTDSEYTDSILTVLSMMDMVWKGHHRHGDESAPLEMSQEAAEMTVQIAVLLVSWFRSGRIYRMSQTS